MFIIIINAVKGIGGGDKTKSHQAEEQRTDRDLSMKIISIGTILTIVITFAFFYLGVFKGNILFAAVGILHKRPLRASA